MYGELKPTVSFAKVVDVVHAVVVLPSIALPGVPPNGVTLAVEMNKAALVPTQAGGAVQT
jgi:hypothetical protein